MRPALLQPLFRLQPQRRLLALGLIGVAMCALPLMQVLRYQAQEIALANAALAGLDPVAGTIAVQRGLVEHRDSASWVLRGQPDAEVPRRQRQAEVDARLMVLASSLTQRAATRALAEADAMKNDWRELVQRIVDRTIAAPDSDAAHRLLVEQTIQVIDLVADALPLRQDSDPSVAPVVQGLAVGLPRLTAALARLPQPTGAVSAAERKAWEPGIKATEAMLEKVLQPLGESRPVGVLKRDRELPDAVARSLAAGHGHLRLLLSPRATAEGLQASHRQALQAHFAVLNAAQVTLASLAESRVKALEAERTRGLLAVGALALLAAALLLTLWTSPVSARAASAANEQPRTDGQWPLRRAAWQLLDRLRGAPPSPGPGNLLDEGRRGTSAEDQASRDER